MTMFLPLIFLQFLLATVVAASQALPGLRKSLCYAVIKGSQGRKYTTGCLSLCDSIDNVINGSCSGIGCCQSIIPKEVRSYNISIFQTYRERTSFPVVLDWAVGNETCVAARKNQTSFACKENSKCYNFDNGPGYRCNCSEGYEGNPYLSNGCQDIDECKISSPCNMTCHNLPGAYVCSCPEGYQGDGKKVDRVVVEFPARVFP
ncbi:hypothetical protein Acr_00g0037100 [Actinidia rufa]|uniref:EGF-like domain-containing protein n=1 Tax=Actinidia rufa TaxID=165716 RepID=A0A7J0DGZ1_9ERIC|nr:hypothetical protein Acr_00g0037100 [Actinidia rufa]